MTRAGNDGPRFIRWAREVGVVNEALVLVLALALALALVLVLVLVWALVWALWGGVGGWEAPTVGGVAGRVG
jgi:hypothetical protein